MSVNGKQNGKLEQLKAVPANFSIILMIAAFRRAAAMLVMMMMMVHIDEENADRWKELETEATKALCKCVVLKHMVSVCPLIRKLEMGRIDKRQRKRGPGPKLFSIAI